MIKRKNNIKLQNKTNHKRLGKVKLNKIQKLVYRLIENSETIQKIIKIDHKLSKKFNYATYKNHKCFKFFSFLRIVTNIIGLPVFLIISKMYTQWGIHLYLSFLISWLLGGLFIEFIAKNFFARLRPEIKYKTIRLGPIKLKKPAGYSFPSGHGFNTGFITMVTLLTPIPPYLKFLVIYISFNVAISRIALGFHYLTDVIVGFILGMIYAIITIKLIMLPKS